MGSSEVTELDHGPGPLSNEVERQRQRDNAPRYRPGLRGHVESHFLKAVSPDGQRALWLRHTLLAPRDPTQATRAELWAIAFSDGGRRKLARKLSLPIDALRVERAPFSLQLPQASFDHRHARGSLPATEAADAVHWDLRLANHAPSFRPFPLEAMYTGAFPRSKSLTPMPDARASGEVWLGAERWQLDEWRAAQGHNWGRSQPEAYAWVHTNALTPADRPGAAPLPASFFEALSGRVRVGPFVTPWLSVGGLQIEGRLFRFDGPRALLARRVEVGMRHYAFVLEQAGARLEGHFRAEQEQLAGLRYEDPDGSELFCLNAKLGAGELRFSHAGRQLHLKSSAAALEIGTRARDHGIELLL